MFVLLFNLFLALGLFVLNGALGKFQMLYRNVFQYEVFSFKENSSGSFAGEFLQKVINPSIFITIVCVFLQMMSQINLVKSLWLTVLGYWLLRFLFYFIRGRLLFLNWRYELISFVISNALSNTVLFACIVPIINSNESVFISLTSLRDAIWFAIISYIVKILWDVGQCSLRVDTILSQERKEKIIFAKYNKFKRLYDGIVVDILDKCQYFDDIRAVIYSIMIFEDYNRPVFFRWIENFLKMLRPKWKFSLGIMQIKTERYISNEESVRLASERIKETYVKNLDSDPVRSSILDYNKSEEYYCEVYMIYNTLIDCLTNDVVG